MNILSAIGNAGKALAAKPAVAKFILKTKKAAPAIAVVGGIAAVGVAYCLAIHEASTMNNILDEHNDKLEEVDKASEEQTIDEKQKKKVVTKTYIRTGLKLAKHFAPSFLVLSLGVGLIGFSHINITKQNVALTAGLASLSDSFSEYRKRVTETIGEEAERKLRYGLGDSIDVVVENEAGEKENYVVYDKNEDKKILDPYARVFDESNVNYDMSHPNFNILFLRKIQNMLNDQLSIKKYVFLNTAYEALGFKPTPEGQLMGWSYDPNHPRYIDLGIMNINDRGVADFINGKVSSILVGFNVDPEPLYSRL